MGVFGILTLAAVMLTPQSPAMQKAIQQNPVLQLIQRNPDYAMFMKISTLAEGGAMVVLALAGVGLLLLWSWGRHLSTLYAVYAIIAVMIRAMVNYHFVIAPNAGEDAARAPYARASRGDRRDGGRIVFRHDLPGAPADLYVPSKVVAAFGPPDEP